MSLKSRAALDAITNAPSNVDSVQAAVLYLVDNQTISADVASLIIHAFEAARPELEAAIAARPEAK